MVALRWSHVFGDLAYTFNYFYGWTSFMFDYTDTGNFRGLRECDPQAWPPAHYRGVVGLPDPLGAGDIAGTGVAGRDGPVYQ